MNLDLGFMFDMINLLTLLACLIVGYLFKIWMPTDNKWIPTVLVVFGSVICCIANMGISLEYIVAGAFTGLASTGLHQAFTQIINNTSSKILTAEVEEELNKIYVDDAKDEEDE